MLKCKTGQKMEGSDKRNSGAECPRNKINKDNSVSVLVNYYFKLSIIPFLSVFVKIKLKLVDECVPEIKVPYLKWCRFGARNIIPVAPPVIKRPN